MTQGKTALIIGAGPAGLTAAWELLEQTDLQPVVIEATSETGGIARTANHRGNRIDLGGHRFFSKSPWVMKWWRDFMPLQGRPARDELREDRPVHLPDDPDAPDPEATDLVMLSRQRHSRILFGGHFYDYPIRMNLKTLKGLGPAEAARIAASYAKARLAPRKPETSLEDFFINRFGKELYTTFFKGYTEKVWGVECRDIPASWGSQRVKGLSISKTLIHALNAIVRNDYSVSQKKTETSLIGQFLYPKLGPGQLWEYVAERIRVRGGQIIYNTRAAAFKVAGNGKRIEAVEAAGGGENITFKPDYVLSSMPVKDLIAGIRGTVPDHARRIAAGLPYRDFLTVGLFVPAMTAGQSTAVPGAPGFPNDNWIYIQEPDVKLGRLQIFNNWSPYLVREPNKAWLGLEYFCNEGDELWSMDDRALAEFAARELGSIGLISAADVEDAVVIRQPKAYPAYFGTYSDFETLREFTDAIANLFLIGRNGMHRYNNMDHSMLTARAAVENIRTGATGKENIWSVNPEGEYHESD